MNNVQGGGLGGNQASKFKQDKKGGFFGSQEKPKSGPPVPVSHNVRVKLPDFDEEDDMSEVDLAAEQAEEELERAKLKHQAQMRKSK